MTEEARATQETSQPSPVFIQLRGVVEQLPTITGSGHGRIAERTLPDGTVLEITHNTLSNRKDLSEDPERLVVIVEPVGVSYTLTPRGELTRLTYKPGFRPSTLGLSVDHIVFELPSSLRKKLPREPQYPAMVQALVDWTQILATADSLEAAGLPFSS